MAAVIFHGNPGSFKSATSVWFEVLPALRAGRVVVTNIEGFKVLEEIEQELNETFPESAQLWRLSSLNPEGKKLWQRWYHWMPVGALIVMDEVQGIYPNTTRFKPETCDYVHVSNYKDLLPPEWINYHMRRLEDFKPEDLTSSDTDDLGRELFNEYGHLIYPQDLEDAYMRHRKYNWDIIACTPDINAVHKYVRSVCQYAYYHRYFDAFEFIPWFYRRPRVHEHNPSLAGKIPAKHDKKVWRKVPLDVHKLYKSTATGHITKGKGKAHIGIVATIPVLLFLSTIGYLVYYFFFMEDPAQSAQARPKGSQSAVSSSRANDSRQADTRRPVSIALPYNASNAWFTGTVTKYRNGQVVGRHYTFTLDIDGSEYTANGSDFRAFGYTLTYINDCTVHARKDGERRILHCRPQLQQERVAETYNQISIFGDDAAPSGA